MSYKKTSKEHRQDKRMQDIAKQIEYEEAIKAPRPNTVSANLPAYAYTAMCPDPEYRVRPENGEERDSG